MSRVLPIVHIQRLVERRTSGAPDGTFEADELYRLVDRLDETGAQTPSVAFMNAGLFALDSMEEPYLLVTTDTRRGAVASWSHTLGMYGVSSVLAVSAEDLGSEGRVQSRDLPLVTGSGAALAARGMTGDPLVGLSVSKLRDELRESHQILSEAAGFPVRLLAPAPTVDGRAVDGLVAREARRAGFRAFLAPGGRAEIDGPEPEEPLTYHTVLPGDTPERLADWIAGDLVARGSTRLERLVRGPRRVLERLGRDS
jgi:hypothetical protein